MHMTEISFIFLKAYDAQKEFTYVHFASSNDIGYINYEIGFHMN